MPIHLFQKSLNKAPWALTDMGRSDLLTRFEHFKKIRNAQHLRHFEIGSGQRMENTDGIGKIRVFLLSVYKLIGIDNFLVILPFTCPRDPLILVNTLAMLM